MTQDGKQQKSRPEKEGGKFIPALCSTLGTLILLAVILSALPLALPRLFGYEVYSVISGSMEPALPVGSVVYVEPAEVSEVEVGDIIAFHDVDTVVTHRVVEIHPDEGEFITKGDANNTTDITPTYFWALIGRVKICIPMLGRLLSIYSLKEGKAALAFFAISGLLFRMIGSTIRTHQTADRKRKAEKTLNTGEGETT